MLIHDIGMGLLALCGVLGLIWLAHRGARAGGFARSSQAGRVRIVQAVSVDPRRRLVLLRLDGAEFLVMTGGATDLLIAGPCPAPQTGEGLAL